MSGFLATSFVMNVWHSLREAFFMLWETLWALILGFTLSGMVQAFVSKDQMQARLGDHRPFTVVRASFFGMVSSSCSYAASAMSKSLFAKGADFTSAMVFMIASTNLVLELGIVLLVLLGWQFMAAEFVGGPIMIAMLALVGGIVFAKPIVEAARAKLHGHRGGHDAMSGVSDQRQAELERTSWSDKMRSPAAWSDASSYAVADVTMLRKELLIGYVVAGFLAVMVPAQWWNALFLHGHGFWTSVENALVGPLIAVISWVCSIGNVPLAAALWSGGISFGGVIAFVFADLIAMPLILIYLKFYGSKLTIRLVATFYVLMAIAGLVTQLIFASLGAVPRTRPVSIAPAHFSWNYTSYLNIAFLILATIVWWLAKNRQRFGGGEGYAIDPVCGMQVRTADAPATVRHDNTIFYFCADRCRERFEADPTRWSTGNAPTEAMDAESNVIDPVCGMVVDPEHAAAHRHHEGSDFWFCAASCAERFDEDPDRFSGESPTYEAMTVPEPVMMTMSRKPAQATAVDPVCGMTIDPEHAAMTITHDGVAYFFCNPGCGERFSADPSTYLGAKRHP